MAAPTFVNEAESAWDNTTTPKTAQLTSLLSGDRVVAGSFTNFDDSADIAVTGGTLSGGWTGGAGTASYVEDTGFQPEGGIWYGTLNGDQTLTASSAFSSTKNHGVCLMAFRASDGFGNVATANANDSAAGSVAITTTQANSAIVVYVIDRNEVDGTSRVWLTVNSITPTSGNGLERVFANGGTYQAYAAYYSDAGAIGSKTVGLSAPTGMRWTAVALEVLGTAAGGGIPRVYHHRSRNFGRHDSGLWMPTDPRVVLA